MFDVGFLEVSVIFVVALIVVGPEKLPGLARTVGLYVGKARRYADFVRREIENEVRTAELKALAEKPTVLNEVKDALTETVDTLKRGLDFLGYHCSREGLTVTKATVARSVTRIRRLDEQERRRPSQSSSLGVYVSRWAEGGLLDLGPLTSALQPPIAR